VISTLPPKPEFDPKPVLNEIEGLTSGMRGDYGVYVYRLESGDSHGIKETKVFTAASLIKLPVMLTVYQEAEKGNLNLADYQDKLAAMGKRSDNAAFSQVVGDLGGARIQTTIDELGMEATSFQENETTPRDIGLFFRKLYRGNLISKEHQEEFLNLLTETIYEDRIPVGIPGEIRVAHKIGTEIGSFSDAGIVFAEAPFVLVIMSDRARESEADEVLHQITKAIWDFETGSR
jgi:beta-lactamase class A